MRDWYLVRTKSGAERTACEHLQHVVDRVLLPLATTPLRQKDRTFQRTGPLFPTYVFAYFNLERAARQIRYTPGVRNIVQFGEQAAAVPSYVIDELTSRCAEGLVDLAKSAVATRRAGKSRTWAIPGIPGSLRRVSQRNRACRGLAVCYECRPTRHHASKNGHSGWPGPSSRPIARQPVARSHHDSRQSLNEPRIG